MEIGIMEIMTLILLVWVHFFADFICQTDKMAINKSSSNKWLSIHVGIYALFLIPFGIEFALVNFALHFITDYISSRATTALWKAEKRHWFFVVIGADQALHLTALIATYPIFVG